MDLHRGLVDLAKQYGPEVQGPNPVVAFLEPDVVLLERVGEEEQPILEADRPGVRDALDQEVPWILERWELRGIGARRWGVACRRWVAAERRVRTHLAVLAPERRERALLVARDQPRPGVWSPP